jgi:hypothetical protein
MFGCCWPVLKRPALAGFQAPRDRWDTHFKLHAPGQTMVEATVRQGKVVDLKVTPAGRRKDVVIAAD